ncbi:MAG: phosphodiester glycosidase family protein [Clostridia bacterium]|nr:phosphodiester glycosidase family protein [Clostridia bacterium]
MAGKGIGFGKALALFAASAMTLAALGNALSVSAVNEKKLDGETGRTTSTLYDGVTGTHISLSSSSAFGRQEIDIVEFDPSQPDLYFEVVPGGAFANSLKKTSAQAAEISKRPDRKVICAVNGDLWMTNAHSRNNGSSYKDYSDPVTTKTYTVPRGFNMYDGEIWSSAHIQQETPYEGDFYAFGITPDGIPVLGKPAVGITVTDTTQNKKLAADGLNRLPANNAVIMYSDKAGTTNYALSDAYEVIIDCEPYTVRHGETITGKVTAISKPGENREAFRENRIVLTARGTAIGKVDGIAVGDEITIDIKVTDRLGNDALWQRMENAVGGHIPVIIDGKSQNSSNTTKYPMTVLGITSAGKVVMLTNDGRQSGYSDGLKISDLDDVCSGLGIVTAFLLDGGGSTAMVQLSQSDTYKVVNRPSDGSERSVVNSVILSAGPSKTSDGVGSGRTHFTFTCEDDLKVISNPFRTEITLEDGALKLTNTEERNQHVYFSVSGLSADEYKYIVVSFKTNSTMKEKHCLGLQFVNGAIYTPSENHQRVIDTESGKIDADGYSIVITDLSKASKWTGKIHGIELHLNEYTDRGNIGEYTLIRSITFCKTAEEAEDAANRVFVTEAPETTAAPDTDTDELPARGRGCRSLASLAFLPIVMSLPALFRRKE